MSLDIRTLIVVCRGCHGERTYKPDAPITSAEQLDAWFKAHLTPCPCGARKCDVKIPIAEIEGANPEGV